MFWVSCPICCCMRFKAWFSEREVLISSILEAVLFRNQIRKTKSMTSAAEKRMINRFTFIENESLLPAL